MTDHILPGHLPYIMNNNLYIDRETTDDELSYIINNWSRGRDYTTQIIHCTLCMHLTTIPPLPIHIKKLYCRTCPMLRTISPSSGLTLIDCSECPIDSISGFGSLEELNCRDCLNLREIEGNNIKFINCSRSINLINIYTPSLEELECVGCPNLNLGYYPNLNYISDERHDEYESKYGVKVQYYTLLGSFKYNPNKNANAVYNSGLLKYVKKYLQNDDNFFGSKKRRRRRRKNRRKSRDI